MSSGISEFNTQTGLIVSDNSEYPAIGTLECNPCSGGGSGGANVIGIRSSNGAPSTDLAAVVTNGLQYSGGAGGTLQIQSDPAPTLEPATLSQVIATASGIKLASTNAPAAGLVYSMNATATGYEWTAPSTGTGMPIGCIIMYYTNTGFTTDPAGAGNGYFLNFGVECWKLCDGTTGSIPATGSAFGATPDLVNKWAKGVNTSAPPAAVAETINITMSSVSLAIPNLPAHNHEAPDAPASTPSTFWCRQPTPPNGWSIYTTGCTTATPGFPNPVGLGYTGGNITAEWDMNISGGSSVGTSAGPHYVDYTQNMTKTTGSGTPFTPAVSSATNITPASQEVLYIVRVF